MSDSVEPVNKHHVGYVDGVNLTISICLTYTLCVTALRGWIRRRLYGWDDVVVGGATVFILGFYAASYVSLHEGLGKKLDQLYEHPSRLEPLNKSTVARLILFVLTLYLSKASVVAFLCRTTKTKKHQIVHYVAFGIFAILGIGSIIAITVDCGNPSKYFYWDLRKTDPYCPSQKTRWQVVTALDVFSEILLAMLPLHLMWELQMGLKKKAIIIAAFYVRLPVIAFSLVGNYWAISHYPFSKDPGLAGALITIWQEVEAAYSLAAVTLSASKAFADTFATGFGWGDTFREVGLTQYGAGSNNRSQTAASRAANSRRRSGGDFNNRSQTSGNGSRHGFRDLKKFSPTSSTDDGSDPKQINIELMPEKNEAYVTNRYAQNEYNYGTRPRTPAREEDSHYARGSWKKKGQDMLSSQNSEYQDPLEGHEEPPMKLRPERKLRNTAVITSDPTFVPQHLKRPAGEGGSVESQLTDDMVIVRNVDYSVRYDEVPIMERAQKNPYSDDR